MAYDDEDDDRQAMYEAFRKSLSKPDTERFFDEEDLVEIFDMAGDRNEAYIQLEALFCGARLYPESPALADRRAVFYMDEDDTNELGSRYLADHAGRHSLLSDIVRLAVAPPRPEERRSALDYILSQYSTFSDEDIIRFVNVAVEIEQYEWVIENLPELRKRVSYLPSLLFEILTEADNREDNDTCVALGEELVELEPFSMQFWAVLFKAYARGGRQDDARSAYEYAKALGANSREYLPWLMDSAMKHARYLVDDILADLGECVREYPDDFALTDVYGTSLLNLDRRPEALGVFEDYVMRHPDQWQALHQLLFCDPADCSLYIERFIDAAGLEELEKNVWEVIPSLFEHGLYDPVEALICAIGSRKALGLEFLAPTVEACIAKGDYKGVCSIVPTMPMLERLAEQPLMFFSVASGVIVAQIKTGDKKGAEVTADQALAVLPSLPSPLPLHIRAAEAGLRDLCRLAHRHSSLKGTVWE